MYSGGRYAAKGGFVGTIGAEDTRYSPPREASVLPARAKVSTIAPLGAEGVVGVTLVVAHSFGEKESS